MTSNNYPVTPEPLDQQVSALREEVEQLKKLLYKIDDIVSGNVRLMVDGVKSNRDISGE